MISSLMRLWIWFRIRRRVSLEPFCLKLQPRYARVRLASGPATGADLASLDAPPRLGVVVVGMACLRLGIEQLHWGAKENLTKTRSSSAFTMMPWFVRGTTGIPAGQPSSSWRPRRQMLPHESFEAALLSEVLAAAVALRSWRHALSSCLSIVF